MKSFLYVGGIFFLKYLLIWMKMPTFATLEL